MRKFQLILGVTRGEYIAIPGRDKKVAPGAYSGWIAEDTRISVDGAAYISDAMPLYASAAVDALDLLELEDDEKFELRIVGSAAGADDFIAGRLRRWDAKNGKNSKGKRPAAYAKWKRLHKLCGLHKVRFTEPTTSYERFRVDMAKMRAKSTLESRLNAGLSSEYVNFEDVAVDY